jgi:hypothetical protein
VKKPLLTFCLFFSCLSTFAQTWQPVGNGVNGYVNTLFVYDSVMYAGGLFTGPGNNIAQWNGSLWNNLSSGTSNQVYAIGSYKGLVYIGGWFSQAGGHSAGNIATWNGTSFANAGFDVEGGYVDVFHVYDSLLFIGGQFDSVNHKRPSGLVTWNGKSTDSLITSYGSYWTNVSILTTYKNLLFLGFGPVSNGTTIVTWNNKVNNNLGNDAFYSTPRMKVLSFNAFCQSDTNLYLGGSFSYYQHNWTLPNDTVNNITMWNGKKWVSLGKGLNGTVYALANYNNLIVAGGSFDSAGGVPVHNIAAWNGTSWSALGNGVNGPVYALAVFNNHLYAGGDFNSPGNGIAMLSDTTIIVNNDSINVFPNPNQGQFTVVCDRVITPSAPVTIDVYNILGQKIYTAPLADGNNTINLEKASSGIYIYRITSAGSNLVNPGKLLVQ